MTLKQAIKITERHQRWRRDNTGRIKMPKDTSRELGKALDILILFCKENDKPKKSKVKANTEAK